MAKVPTTPQHPSANAPKQEAFATDQLWFDALRAHQDPLLLKLLANNGGAVLWWQISLEGANGFYGIEHAVEDALERGVIKFDTDTDLYVHPDAIKVADGGYTMPEAK